MKFASITEGSAARRTVRINIAGQQQKVDVRVLTPGEEGQVLARAAAFAKDHGVDHAVDGDPLFDYGRWLHTCLLACIDTDSPTDKPVPYFDSVDQILQSKMLTRTHLSYLANQQEIWQDENSPYETRATDDQVLQRVEAIAEGEIGPFAELPPAMQWLLVRTMASRYVALLGHKSFSGSGSAENSAQQSVE